MKTAHPGLAYLALILFVVGILLNIGAVMGLGIALLCVSIVFTYAVRPNNEDVYADNPNIPTALKRLWKKYTF